MQKIIISTIIMITLVLSADNAFAQSYCLDFLEPGNPGGRTTSLKTCDAVNPVRIDPGSIFEIEIWVADVPPPDLTAGLLTSGFKMAHDPSRISIVSVQAYDYVDIPDGPWSPIYTLKFEYVDYYELLLGNWDSCAIPDVGGDVILAKITFQYLSGGSATISFSGLDDFDTTVGCGFMVYDSPIGMHTITVSEPDSDADAVPDSKDNCLHHPNGPLLGTCTSGPRQVIGIVTCTSNTDCDPNGFCSMNQEDIYPPGGNGVGDACDCEGNFDCDADVDGSDAMKFKEDFGRNTLKNPCPNCAVTTTTTVLPSTTTTEPYF
jgi:hypothetical protein